MWAAGHTALAAPWRCEHGREREFWPGCRSRWLRPGRAVSGCPLPSRPAGTGACRPGQPPSSTDPGRASPCTSIVRASVLTWALGCGRGAPAPAPAPSYRPSLRSGGSSASRLGLTSPAGSGAPRGFRPCPLARLSLSAAGDTRGAFLMGARGGPGPGRGWMGAVCIPGEQSPARAWHLQAAGRVRRHPLRPGWPSRCRGSPAGRGRGRWPCLERLRATCSPCPGVTER